MARSLPPQGAHNPERGVWIREQIIRDEVEGFTTRDYRGRLAVRLRQLALQRRRWGP